MTREEAHGILSNGLANAPSEHEWCMAFEMAIKALEQEPCEDCVSRQSVLDLVVANHRELNGVNVVMYSPLYKDIKELPSVNPQTDALDKIRAEIETNTEKWWYGVNDDCFMKLSDVLEIIDKYRKEQI